MFRSPSKSKRLSRPLTLTFGRRSKSASSLPNDKAPDSPDYSGLPTPPPKDEVLPELTPEPSASASGENVIADDSTAATAATKESTSKPEEAKDVVGKIDTAAAAAASASAGHAEAPPPTPVSKDASAATTLQTKGSMYAGGSSIKPIKKGKVYDFRSDTVTTPTPGMLQAMLTAELGDDVFDDDPTIHKLQDLAVKITGHEAALFCATGTMTNQLGIRSLLNMSPPYSIVCDARAHIHNYEASGIAHTSSAAVYAVQPKGAFLTVEEVAGACVLDDDVHHAPTKVIALENTLGGEIMDLEDIRKISKFARENGLKMHLDGARIWNATVATGISLTDYCKEFDSVSLCLSKGLGAPIGSVLVGSRDLIKRARHFRKMLGGGWRQAGILAAAGIFAIEHHWAQMKQDHERAQRLGKELQSLGYKLDKPVVTNMVWVDTAPVGVALDEFRLAMAGTGYDFSSEESKGSKNIYVDSKTGDRLSGIILGSRASPGIIRLVIHHQIDDEAIAFTVRVAESLLKGKKGKGKKWF